MTELPQLIEPEQLETLLQRDDIVIIDLSRAATHADMHIPGARYMDYNQIVRAKKPVMGLLPTSEQFSQVLSASGITPDTHVVAYDDEGGGKAARLLWTLACYGHRRYSLLNGGLHAWANEGHPLSKETAAFPPSHYEVSEVQDESPVAQRPYILAHLDDPSVALLDARSPQEFRGEKRYAERAGRIPGAINIEWTEFMDQSRNLRLKPDEQLRQMLEKQGFTTDKTVVAYCQTHHRSAHTWFVLNYLGYRVRGYEGSWSDWGNSPDTPIEI